MKDEENIYLKEDNSLEDNNIRIDTDMGVYEISPNEYIKELMETLEESFNENN